MGIVSFAAEHNSKQVVAIDACRVQLQLFLDFLFCIGSSSLSKQRFSFGEW